MGLMRRSPLLIMSAVASVGATAIYLLPLPAVVRMSWPYALLFTAVGAVQLIAAGVVVTRPSRARLLLAAAAAFAVVVLWALARLGGVLPDPDPWVPANSVIGFTDIVCAILAMVAAVGFLVVALRRPRVARSWPRRILSWVGAVPLTVVVLLFTTVGVVAASDGFAGAGYPAGTVAPRDLPAGQASTVEYCRPDGVPLAMDVYMPPADTARDEAAPVVMYVHGGGAIGDRKMYGAGASLANHEGALFPRLQPSLNARGFVVASFDHRLPPGTPWPAQIEDAKCAVRFLRAHAADLGIDPDRIGVWGPSGGGHLASLLGLTGPEDGFDVGQYVEDSSRVQAVVDMFGLADLNDFDDAAPAARLMAQISFGGSTELRRTASPVNHVRPDAPPFLILHGTADDMVVPRQSTRLAERLDRAGVSITFVEVRGAEHSLVTPHQEPTPDELTATIIDFVTEVLGPT